MDSKTKRIEPFNLQFPEDEIIMPNSSGIQHNRRERKILIPHLGLERNKLKYKLISPKKSSRYDWHNSAPPEMWATAERSDLTQHYQQKFRHFVHFERIIDYYQIRPVKIPFSDKQGNQHHYQPLALLTYSPKLFYVSMRPVLVDVWSDDEIRGNWSFLYPAIRAARDYAKARGWRFCLIRDYFFKTPLYLNACFLLRYRSYKVNNEYYGKIINGFFYKNRVSTINEVLEKVSNNREERIAMMPQLFYLIDANYLGYDKTKLLNENSQIWFDYP